MSRGVTEQMLHSWNYSTKHSALRQEETWTAPAFITAANANKNAHLIESKSFQPHFRHHSHHSNPQSCSFAMSSWGCCFGVISNHHFLGMNTVLLKSRALHPACPGNWAVPDHRTDVKNKLENGNTHVQRGQDSQKPEKKCSKLVQNRELHSIWASHRDRAIMKALAPHLFASQLFPLRKLTFFLSPIRYKQLVVKLLFYRWRNIDEKSQHFFCMESRIGNWGLWVF